jgi:uncharacterized protein YbjT (DUF2867 family)
MILLTGATGSLGKEIAIELARKKRAFKCLVRNSSNVTALEALGATLFYGDATDSASLTAAMDGVDAVISCHSIGPPKKDVTCWDVDYKSNMALINRLIENGGGKYVFISALGTTLSSGFPLWKVKQVIEDTLKVSGLDYTVLRPSGFFSDFTMSHNLVRKYGIYPVMGHAEHRIQGIHMRDIAYCAADAVTNKKAKNRVFEMGGPEVLTYNRIAQIFSDVLGRKVRILPISTGLATAVGLIGDTVTGYRYDMHGFIDAFAAESMCDNGPLLDAFDIELAHFGDYAKAFFADS